MTGFAGPLTSLPPEPILHPLLCTSSAEVRVVRSNEPMLMVWVCRESARDLDLRSSLSSGEQRHVLSTVATLQ